MPPTIEDIPINDNLKSLGVTSFKKQGQATLLLLCKNNNKDNVKETAAIFPISKDGPYDTLMNFENVAKGKLKKVTIEAIKVVLLQEDNGYFKFLLYGDGNGNGHVTVEEQEELSISEALRRKKGYVRVKGQVIGHSSIYDMIVEVKLRCNNCGFDKKINYSKKPVFRSPVKELSKCPIKLCSEQGLPLRADPEYITTIDVELQDPDKFSEIERIRVRLFEENTKDVFAGKIVTITGHIHVVRENDNPSNKPTPVIYAESIEDMKKEQTKLTEKDIEEILAWKKSIEEEELRLDVIHELACFYAPQIIGYEHVKKGLLMACANAGITNNEKRTPKRLRINALLIGDPSLAKSTILRKVIDIVPNARYESCQSSTGLSLTAQVSKEEGNIYTLRHGPIPLANGSICALNEIGQMPISEHKHFLDTMQEGQFTLNKHGFNAPIHANTSIVASANPINNTWKDSETIEQNEFPTLTQITHRFDFIFIFRENRDPDYLRGYTSKRDEIAKMSNEGVFDNYDNFLKKYLMYARTFEPAFYDEARTMLNEYLVNIADAGVTGLPRKLESLESTAIALAKLKLKNVVDAEEAIETMEFFNVILLHFKQTAVISKNPRDVTYIECVSILEGSPFPLSFEELIKSACQRNEQVKRYIGDKYTLEYNFKLRPILDLLIKNSHIAQVNQKPIALRWITIPEESNIKINHPYDESDASEVGVSGENSNRNSSSSSKNDGQSQNDPVGRPSDTSDTSDRRYISREESSTASRQPSSFPSFHKPIVSVEEFFDDNPGISYEYQVLPPHDLEQSPCYPIIVKIGEFYRCKVHPKEQNIYLETIEHHCKYKDPELHKSEIVRLTSTTATATTTTAEAAAAAEAARKNILYAAFQVSQKQAFHNSGNRI